VSQEKWGLLATVCAKLHNICVDKNIPSLPRHHENTQQDDDNLVFSNIIHEEDDNRPLRAAGQNAQRRQVMTRTLLESMGLLPRPAHAFNSNRI